MQIQPTQRDARLISAVGQRKDERHVSNNTRSGTVRITWSEWTVVPNPWSFGHGVHFHDRKKPRESDLVAFVDGYRWLHENPEEVVVHCIKPDEVTTKRTLDAMKRRIESLLLAKSVPCGIIARRIEAIPNA